MTDLQQKVIKELVINVAAAAIGMSGLGLSGALTPEQLESAISAINLIDKVESNKVLIIEYDMMAMTRIPPYYLMMASSIAAPLVQTAIRGKIMELDIPDIKLIAFEMS